MGMKLKDLNLEVKKLKLIFNNFIESAADAQKRLGGDVNEDNVENEQESFIVQKRQNWKKSNAGKQTRIKYKTIDEVVGDGNSNRFGASLISLNQQSGIKVV